MKYKKVIIALSSIFALLIIGGVFSAFSVAISGDNTPDNAANLQAGDVKDIQILNINDFHGRIDQDLSNDSLRIPGAGILAGAVKNLRASNPNTAFVSAGDNIGASTFTSLYQNDIPTAKALMSATLDLSAVGNHEFDGGWQANTSPNGLVNKINNNDYYGIDGSATQSRYFLGANVYNGDTGPNTHENLALQPYYIKDIDGVNVAFIGVVTPETAAMENPTGVHFGNEVEAINREVTAIGSNADVFVVLAHDGVIDTANTCNDAMNSNGSFGELLRDADPRVSLVISGHTHEDYACKVTVPGQSFSRNFIQTGNYGVNLGKTIIHYNTTTSDIDVDLPENIQLINGTKPSYIPAFPADPDTQAIVQDADNAAAAIGNQSVGYISKDITRSCKVTAMSGGCAEDDRSKESPLNNLIADAFVFSTTAANGFTGSPAVLGVNNPGSVRTDLLYGSDGKVTYANIISVQPFAQQINTATMTGGQIKQMLEEQWQPCGSSRPYLQLSISSDWRYEYKGSIPTTTWTCGQANPDTLAGSHIVRIFYKGRLVKDTDTFKVASNSFLMPDGGDNFPVFKVASNLKDSTFTDFQSFASIFEKQSAPIAPPSIGRVRLVQDPWANITLSSSSIEQGKSLKVTVSGLASGQIVKGAIVSSSADLGEKTADANGSVVYTTTIPLNFTVGHHTFSLSSESYNSVSTDFTVTKGDSSSGGSGGGSSQGNTGGGSSGSDSGSNATGIGGTSGTSGSGISGNGADGSGDQGSSLANSGIELYGLLLILLIIFSGCLANLGIIFYRKRNGYSMYFSADKAKHRLQ